MLADNLTGLRRRGSAPATTEATTELWCEFTWGCAFLAFTSITATIVATVPAITTIAPASTTTASTTLSVISANHTLGWCVGALLLDMGGGYNFGRKMEPFAEVIKTLWGQSVIVPLPGELGLDVATGSQGLASLDDLRLW
jgi:hypothetical protein